MKEIKIVLLALNFLIFSEQLYAQKEISLSFGLNRSNLVWTNFEESGWQYKTDYFVGLRNVFINHHKVELSSEIQFSNKGWSTEDSNGDKQTFKYIDGIHLLTYKPIEYVGFYGGLNTGVLLNKSKVISDRTFDLGLLTGVSIGSNKIKIFAHYNYGLLNNELNSPGIKELGIKALNSNFQLGVRYSFLNRKTEKKSLINLNSYEIGISSTNLKSFKAILKKQMDDRKYLRYELLFSELNLNGINTKEKELSINFQLGFGVETRKQIQQIEILSGLVYRLGVSYESGQQFSVNPFVGYLIGVQYKIKSKLNFGMELIPGITVNYINLRNSESIINSNFTFINLPNFFITYNLNNQ